MKRIKQQNPVKSRADMEALAGEIARLKIEEAMAKAGMDEQINAIRKGYEQDLAALAEQIQGKMALAADWAERNAGEFGGKKSMDMIHAVVGWRTGNPTLKTLAGWTWAKVLEKLKTLSAMSDYVRVKEEVNKEAILNDRSSVGDEGLRAIGTRVVQEEVFYVEPKLTEITKRESTEAA